jgi:dTDP-glucose 4,6-dehydratase
MNEEKLKILVTGATGFVGVHIVPELIKRKYNVFILERYVPGRYDLGKRKDVKKVFGDIREYFAIKQVIHDVQPDVVIHLVAISPVAYSFDRPHEVLETNLLGTVNLAEACLREVPDFQHFLFASTSETYGNGPSPKTEKTQQNPNSPYAVSKLACEKYLFYLRDAYGFPMTILRNFNTYGRKDNAHFVVERTIVQMLQEEVVRLGDPTPKRDFLYIDDHVNSYLTCIQNPEAKGEVFNFCTGRETSIEQLIDLIAKLTDFKGEILWNTVPARPLEIKEVVGDYSKAKRILGWQPQFALEEGLKLTVGLWKTSLETAQMDDRRQTV